jgi:putative membrane protein
MRNKGEEQSEIEYSKCQPKPPDIMADDRVLLAWQRSHMANERTFLAWSRTSIGLLAFGFLIERFDIFVNHILRLEGIGRLGVHHTRIVHLSIIAFFLAAVLVVASGLRFLSVRRHINRGEAVFSLLPEFLVIASVIVVIVMAVMLSIPQIAEVGDTVW